MHIVNATKPNSTSSNKMTRVYFAQTCEDRYAMSKESEKDKMREEYFISKLKGGVKGKYYPKEKAGTNLVLIDPDLPKFLPNDESVNRALRLLLETASDATKPSHSTQKEVKKSPNPRPKRASRIPTSR